MDRPPDANEERLERAIDAMRQAPELGEFPADAVLRNIAASRDAARQQPTLLTRRWTMKTYKRLAAMIVLALGAAVVAFTLLRPGGSVAFAEVARQLHEARTLAADMTTTQPDGKAIRSRLYYDVSGRYRLESGDFVTVTDATTGMTLSLDRTHKQATIIRVSHKPGDAGPAQDPSKFLDQLVHVEASGATPVGESDVNSRHAKGFEISQEGQKAIVWADAKTGEPLRLEMSIRTTPAEKPISVVMDHLAINPTLDDALFSTAVPPGYAQQRMDLTVPTGEPGEKDVVEFLRQYAAAFDGNFPPGLQPAEWAASLKLKLTTGAKTQAPATAPSQQTMQLFVLSGRVTRFLGALPHGYHYAGKAVRLGQGDKPIFWYKSDDSDNDRVVYGDLRVATVPAGDLPEQGNQ